MKRVTYVSYYQRKKGIILLLIFISLCVWIYACRQYEFSCFSVAADAEEELNAGVEELLKTLDLQALQEYVNSLNQFSDTNVAERLLAYIGGESLNYESIGKEIKGILFSSIATNN